MLEGESAYSKGEKRIGTGRMWGGDDNHTYKDKAARGRPQPGIEDQWRAIGPVGSGRLQSNPRPVMRGAMAPNNSVADELIRFRRNWFSSASPMLI